MAASVSASALPWARSPNTQDRDAYQRSSRGVFLHVLSFQMSRTEHLAQLSGLAPYVIHPLFRGQQRTLQCGSGSSTNSPNTF
ncbi:hypothetical protein [Chthonomonas calidirosea]|uniref:hypothetical protein n=1 Tax=Chthonomonas calidirosea TaxID=454171 RepID=UPI0012E3C256|nr:hypothetical protein [Chthonomonas calidirosea]